MVGAVLPILKRKRLTLSLGSSSSFQTDADISGNQARGERTLQKWVPEGPDNTDLSLDSGGAGTWDQFATNSQLFGAQSTYDENLYTTAIDRSAPSYKRREAEAARIAREIEGQTSGNSHVREERGQAVEHDGEDEEDKYSGVRRTEGRSFPPLPVGGPNKYTPPARRAPTGQATVPGAPVDPAIISAQMAPPKAKPGNKTTNDVEKPAVSPAETPTPTQHGGPAASISSSPSKEALASSTELETGAEPTATDLTNKLVAQGPTENVEVKVLNQFRQFADIEKQRVIERRKAQANQDRTAKLNELLRFSKSFKLKTPIPSDLIGILAKDPAKQEAIVEKAKEHTESAVPTTAPAPAPAVAANSRKPDAPQSQPSIPDRQTFNRGRGGYAPNGRSDRAGSQQQSQPPLFPSRNGSGPYPSRFPHQSAGKGIPPHQIPAPIPIIDGRIPPAGPMADQSGLSSPQRSNMHTPASGISGKFNLNVKASEFRPNAAATTFNPTSSQPPSSPSSTQRGASISRTASPSAFFGHRKPKAVAERPSITKDFNPIVRMRREFASSKPDEPVKDYSNNGGIPNAFQTGPRWTVKDENDQKTYEEAFNLPTVPVVSPSQSRSASTHHVPYPGQGGALPNGPAVIPHISTPQHGPHAVAHQYPHPYDDGSHRMQFGTATPNIYPSPNMASRQASAYASPMNHPAQLAYQQQQQQPYFGTPGAQVPVGMRAYPGTPGMIHAQVGQMTAPMMIQQPSNGPYMAVPSQFGHQVPMYSPSPAHVYPQQNGYSSPQRMAPIMMHQGSQQGHQAPSMMYSMSNQGGPIVYPQQQVGMARGNYGGHQYGNAPGYGMQHRTMSSGYPQIPQKGYPQHMQANHGPNMNGPPQGPAYAQLEGAQDEGK